MLLALALPGLSWWPLLLFFPGLMLWALDRSGSTLRAVMIAGLAGVVHWCVATSWVVEVMHGFGGLPLIVSLVCVLVMAVILGFCWAVVGWVTVSVPGRLRPWMFPAAWTVVESAKQLPPYLFPWNSTAACFSGRPELLGSLPVWGATGLGWAAVALGALLYAAVSGPHRRAPLAAAAGVLGLAAALSWFAPSAIPLGEPMSLAAIQPGTTLDEKWNPAAWPAIKERVWQHSREAAAQGAEVVLWPESAVPHILETDRLYAMEVGELARELQVAVVLNSIGSAPQGGYTNSVYVVGEAGVVPPRYDKQRLVPFGEYVPAWAQLAFTKPLVREVASFTPGSRPVLLDVGTPMAMALCYEVVFADVVAAEVRAGATVLATVTNDGWYGDSWAPPQHFAQAVLRAAESRRWLVRAALTGISGVVDPMGRVRSRLELGRSGHLVAEVQPCVGLTPRTRLGDWWAVLCAAAVVVLLILGRRAEEPRSGHLLR